MKKLIIGLFAVICSLGILVPMQTYSTFASTKATDSDQMIVSNLKAESVGTTSNKLTWNAVKGADGYIIYRQDSKKNYGYRYMVKGSANTTYTDTTAETGKYNFYWVYPYKEVNGKRIIGKVKKYTYAKAKPAAVSNLKAASVNTNTVKLTWNAVKNVDGYVIYRKVRNGKFEYRYLVKNTSFTDTTAKTGQYNYYRVYPYKNVNGNKILGSSKDYVYAKPIPAAVTNLKAVSTGTNSIKLTWTGVSNVDGYVIYRKVGNGKFEYRYLVNNTSFTDTTAKTGQYNFYRVYPYKNVNGNKILGVSKNYVYSKAIPNSVTGLKVARNNYHGITISWNSTSNVDGYIIYCQEEGEDEFTYLGMTAKNSYNHNDIYDSRIRFYRVYAYKRINGNNVLSKSTSYIYGRSHDKPSFKGIMLDETKYNCTAVGLKIYNTGKKPLIFLSEGASLSNDSYYWDRSLSMVDINGNSIESITIQPGEEKTLLFSVIGTSTVYDKYSSILLLFHYDELEYLSSSSSYYGYMYNY